MIDRLIKNILKDKLSHFAAIGLLGVRQVGKTTLALEIAKSRPSIYLDLENPADLGKLEDPLKYFELHDDKLIILDEVQRKPELFPILRGVIDANRRKGHKTGQFLILGSASADLLRQSSESLAGRIIYLQMNPINIQEFQKSIDTLWMRGGFPESLVASSDEVSMDWRHSFITTYLERDIPMFGYRLPSETLRRLWTMLGHHQGVLFNASQLAGSLGISNQSVARYVDLLNDLFLIRKLKPWYVNVGKRLTKSPKVYVRDSGVLHSLLGIHTLDTLLGHPIAGASWEGFVIDNIISVMPLGSEAYFYRTTKGAEIDLLLRHVDGRILAIEIKKSQVPKLERGYYEACKDVNPTHKFVVYQGNEKYPLKEDVFAIGLIDMMQEVSNVVN